jgi:GNAT superfamily N-acetyltransferase
MNNSFTVREATAADAPILGWLREEMFEEMGRYPDAGGPAFRDASAAAFADTIARGTCVAWLAQSAIGEPIGSNALLIFPRLPSPESLAIREGYLLSVYTAPPWRRLGVATALVAASIERARALGLARIRLHATAEGERIYAAAGFRVRQDEMELRMI